MIGDSENKIRQLTTTMTVRIFLSVFEETLANRVCIDNCMAGSIGGIVEEVI